MQEEFKKLFDKELIRIKSNKARVMEELEFSRPTLSNRLNNPSSFKIYEVKKLIKMGFKLDYFSNINKFKW